MLKLSKIDKRKSKLMFEIEGLNLNSTFNRNSTFGQSLDYFFKCTVHLIAIFGNISNSTLNRTVSLIEISEYSLKRV